MAGPDILLTIGADPGPLRAELERLRREVGAGIGLQVSPLASQSVQGVATAAQSAGTSLREVNTQEKAATASAEKLLAVFNKVEGTMLRLQRNRFGVEFTQALRLGSLSADKFAANLGTVATLLGKVSAGIELSKTESLQLASALQ